MATGEGIHRDTGRQTSAPGAHIFSVTVNTKDRVAWMNNTAVQNSLAETWTQEATAWFVGYYLLMPDHLHFFCAPHDLHFDIDTWVEFWKRQFSRRHLTEAWSWQRKSFHHRLRNRQEYEEKLMYVRENSLRKKLATGLDDWPYQGQIHDLCW